jgi:hypothetical protein
MGAPIPRPIRREGDPTIGRNRLRRRSAEIGRHCMNVERAGRRLTRPDGRHRDRNPSWRYSIYRGRFSPQLRPGLVTRRFLQNGP